MDLKRRPASGFRLPLLPLGIVLLACAGQAEVAPADGANERWHDVPAPARTVLAELSDARGDRWYLVSGWQCADCDAPVALYLTRDTTSARMRGPYDAPGAYFQMGDEEGPADAEVRAFAGDCIAPAGDELVLLHAEREAGESPERSAYIAHVGGVEADAAWSAPLETALLAAVGAGRCAELPGDTLYY